MADDGRARAEAVPEGLPLPAEAAAAAVGQAEDARNKGIKGWVRETAIYYIETVIVYIYFLETS